jgi:CRISPR-associated endonuclease Csn1
MGACKDNFHPTWTGVKMRILGIDLGSRSVGWALLEGPTGDAPQSIVAAGVRIFTAGVEGSIEQGRDSSRAASRREARLLRRQTARRARRQRKLYLHLSRAGLLPNLPDLEAETRDATLKALDKDLLPLVHGAGLVQQHHLFPYLLRKMAIEQELPAFAVGRALYHIGQRRGFQSNRRLASDSEKEELKVVAKGIGDLDAEIQASGARTLGAYLATLNPEAERVRRRYTSRAMYRNEFDAIWNFQSPCHSSMTDAARKKITSAIFHQRPLRSAKHLIGKCSLESGQ